MNATGPAVQSAAQAIRPRRAAAWLAWLALGCARCRARTPRTAMTCGCATGRWSALARALSGSQSAKCAAAGRKRRRDDGTARAFTGSAGRRAGRSSTSPPATAPSCSALRVLGAIAAMHLDLEGLGSDGYLLRSAVLDGHRATVIAANSDAGVIYGAFQFLRLLQIAATARSSGAALRAAGTAPRLGSLGQSRRHGRARLCRRIHLGLAEAA